MRYSELTEGRNDPHIFKAIFLVGGPGSGKSYVEHKLLSGTGLKSVNSDDAFEYLLRKHNLDMKMPDHEADRRNQVRDHAKGLTRKREEIYLSNRMGVIISGTGKSLATVRNTNEKLKALGYETAMVFVNTTLPIAQARNLKRARSLPQDVVSTKWAEVQENLMKFQQVFGNENFFVVDNSDDSDDNIDLVYMDIQKFLNTAPSHRFAKQWLDRDFN